MPPFTHTLWGSVLAESTRFGDRGKGTPNAKVMTGFGRGQRFWDLDAPVIRAFVPPSGSPHDPSAELSQKVPKTCPCTPSSGESRSRSTLRWVKWEILDLKPSVSRHGLWWIPPIDMTI